MEIPLSVSALIDRIKEKCSVKELENIGVNQKTFSGWKMNERFPKSDDLFKISQYVGCTMEYLLTGTKIDDDYIFLSQKEQYLLNTYKKLSDEQKKALEVVLDAFNSTNQ